MNPFASRIGQSLATALFLFSASCLVAQPPSTPAALNEGATQGTAKPPPTIENPPVSWVDPDTGHRVIRLTNEPGSDSFYFNVNGYTPDGKEMVYTSREGIHVLDLGTLKTRLLVKMPENARIRPIVVGYKTPTVYYTLSSGPGTPAQIWRAGIDDGTNAKLVDLPLHASVVTINSDETLGAGTFIEGDQAAGASRDSAGYASRSQMSSVNMGEPLDKGQMMERRLAAKYPMTLFTVNLKDGKITPLLQHDTNWINHLQFSPTEPTLLMYCHEGPWWKVDRIWTIRTDGTQNQLVHKRTMEREIAGHEWWGSDGKTLWYQLHFFYGTDAPADVKTSFVAGYNVETGQRTWYRYGNDATSIHDNISPDGKLFCGDGGTKTPWIFLLRPKTVLKGDTFGKDLIGGGYLEAEPLVNMKLHNYRLEPNPSFTPDMKYIIFRSNMFGPDYAFAVEVAKFDAEKNVH